ncbi:MAG: HEAT repeat domain-containing protein, partial [Nannocystaceae bacterium]
VADEATVEGLISLLEHSDVQAVSASAKLLALVGGEASFSSLLNVLHVGEVASAATMMLRRLGTEGKALLAAALQRGRAGPCYAQCLALVGELTVDEIEDDLVSMLSVEVASEDEEIMAAALRSLGRTGGLGQLPALLGACERDDGLGDAAADAVAEVLARAGKREIPVELLPEQRWPSSGSLARNLCRVAGKLSNEASVASLVFLLASSDIDVRVAAAHALGEIQGQHEGVGALAFALADEEAHVRAAACRSLGALGSIDSLNSLLAASSDASSLVRAAAVQALVQLDNPVAASRMREIILEDSSPTVVVHAIEGLKVVHDEQTLGLVMSLCTSADSEVAKAAARVLRGFPSHRATAALIGLLAHERWDVRWVAAESLGTRGDPTAIGAITQVLLKEGDALVARTLQETLDRLEDLGAPSKTERGARHE